jgi:small conductance mechanosensitive channel
MQDSEIIEKTEKSWSELSDKVINWVDSIVLNLPNFLIATLVIIIFVVFAKYASRLVDKIFRKSTAQDSIRTVSVKVFRVVIISLGIF